MPKLATCLWFDGHAEEAVKFYTSIFKNSRIGKILRFGNEGQEVHGSRRDIKICHAFTIAKESLIFPPQCVEDSTELRRWCL